MEEKNKSVGECKGRYKEYGKIMWSNLIISTFGIISYIVIISKGGELFTDGILLVNLLSLFIGVTAGIFMLDARKEKSKRK